MSLGIYVNNIKRNHILCNREEAVRLNFNHRIKLKAKKSNDFSTLKQTFNEEDTDGKNRPSNRTNH